MNLDWSTIVVGLLALLGTVAGSYFSNNKTTALISYRIKELEDRVNKHNNLVERMAIVERDMKTAFNQIEDIKDEIHEIHEQK